MEGTELSFMETLVGMLSESEAAQGTVSGFLIGVLSVPMALIGQVLKWAPDWLIPPETVPVWLAGIGWIAGAAIGYFTVLPMSLAMTVGMGAGLGAKSAHDLHKKYRKYNGGDK